MIIVFCVRLCTFWLYHGLYSFFSVLGYDNNLSVRFFEISVRALRIAEQTDNALLLATRACSFSSYNSRHSFILTVLRQFCTYGFPDLPFICLTRQ